MASLADAITAYNTVCKFPFVTTGLFNHPDNNSATLYFKQRNVVADEFESFQAIVSFAEESTFSFNAPPACNGNSTSYVSPSGNKQVVVRMGSAGQQLMLYWLHNRLEHTVDLQSSSLHGKILDRAPHFHGTAWSKDERFFFYMAEKLAPKSCSFFDANIDSKMANGVLPGGEYQLRENWGETLLDVSKTVICAFDSVHKSVIVLKYDGGEDWCLRTFVVDPIRSNVLYCLAYQEYPFHLGLAWITTRQSSLIRLTNWQSDEPLVDSGEPKAIVGLTVSPDGSKLVWLQTESGIPMNRSFDMWRQDLPDGKPTRVTFSDVQPLYFASLSSPFVKNCWLSDNKHVLVNSVIKSQVVVLSIDVINGQVIQVFENDDSSFCILDVYNDKILGIKSNPALPIGLLVGRYDKERGNFNSWERSLYQPDVSLADKIDWSVESVQHSSFECHFISIRAKNVASKVPLIALIHGGPHSSFSTSFSGYVEEAMSFVLSGFDVILVNYCGSLGFDSVEALPGRLGDLDVASAHQCIQHAVTNDRNDPKRVYLASDSFGGFVTLHLVSKYPEFYRAAVCRNPVADVTLMGHIADCADWAFIQANCCPSSKGIPRYLDIVTSKVSSKMNELSPMNGIPSVKCPLLFAFGRNDIRVPMSIGLSYLRMLKQTNPDVDTETYLYGDGHLISSVKSHADLFINSIAFFHKHC